MVGSGAALVAVGPARSSVSTVVSSGVAVAAVGVAPGRGLIKPARGVGVVGVARAEGAAAEADAGGGSGDVIRGWSRVHRRSSLGAGDGLTGRRVACRSGVSDSDSGRRSPTP